MYHFFVPQDQIGPERIFITGADVNHIKNVLRMKPGEEIFVNDNVDKSFRCRIVEIESEVVWTEILDISLSKAELPAKLYLFQGLPKQEKMEWIIQKAVELGAYQVIPVATRRSVTKLDAKKAEAKVKRWNGIAEAGAKQSGRSVIPQVTQVMSMREALEYGQDFDVKMIPYEKARGMEQTKTVMDKVRPGVQAGIFIGPEGGFEEAEIEEAVKAGFEPISLGSRILRTETAGLAVLAVAMYQLETEARQVHEMESK